MRWFGKDKTEGRIQAVVQKAVLAVLATAEFDVLNAVQLTSERDRLKRQIADLEISRDKKQEDFDRKQREIEHSLGLHKAQVEWEVEEASARARLEVETANLATEREAFEERMTFMQDRFEEESKYQRNLLGQMMERLPSAKILAKIGNADTD